MSMDLYKPGLIFSSTRSGINYLNIQPTKQNNKKINKTNNKKINKSRDRML